MASSATMANQSRLCLFCRSCSSSVMELVDSEQWIVDSKSLGAKERELTTDNWSYRTGCRVRFQRVSVKKCSATWPIQAMLLANPDCL